MIFEIKVDGQVAVKADVDTSVLRSLLHVVPAISAVPQSTAFSAAQGTELLSRIAPESVHLLRQMAANNGEITWGEARAILGIKDQEDWSSFSASYGKGVTRALKAFAARQIRTPHLVE